MSLVAMVAGSSMKALLRDRAGALRAQRCAAVWWREIFIASGEVDVNDSRLTGNKAGRSWDLPYTLAWTVICSLMNSLSLVRMALRYTSRARSAAADGLNQVHAGQPLLRLSCCKGQSCVPWYRRWIRPYFHRFLRPVQSKYSNDRQVH